MHVYHYHPITSEFINAFPARLDPRDQKPLVPRNATLIAPPASEPGFVQCFIDGKWEQVEDHRGEVWYRGRALVRIERLGPVPGNLTPDLPPIPNEDKIKKIRTERDARLGETDWMVLPDCPLDKAELEDVIAYRQALRDLPENITDPDAVAWPELVLKNEYRSLRKTGK